MHMRVCIVLLLRLYLLLRRRRWWWWWRRCGGHERRRVCVVWVRRVVMVMVVVVVVHGVRRLRGKHGARRRRSVLRRREKRGEPRECRSPTRLLRLLLWNGRGYPSVVGLRGWRGVVLLLLLLLLRRRRVILCLRRRGSAVCVRMSRWRTVRRCGLLCAAAVRVRLLLLFWRRGAGVRWCVVPYWRGIPARGRLGGGARVLVCGRVLLRLLARGRR
jgi:hypothetical protein